MKGVLEIGPDHPESDIGIALRTVPHIIRFLAAAIVAFGIPTATLDDILSVCIGRGGPWKIQCKLPPKTKRFCPLVLK